MNKIFFDENLVRELYTNRESFETIAQKVGCDRVTLRKFIKRNNFPKRLRANRAFNHYRLYNYNENYFDIIDTEEKAYFLGLLYADGCNTRVGFSIALQDGDQTILEKFKNTIEYSGNIKYIKPKIDKTGKYGESKPQWLLVITNLHLSKKLEEIGCVPAKSLILKFPTEDILPKSLYSHFIRGYFDGDGGLYIDSKGKGSVNITGNRDFIDKLQQILIENCNLNRVKYKISNNNHTVALFYNGNIQCCRIREWLYKDATVYLERKYEKFYTFKVYKKEINTCLYCDCNTYGKMFVCSKHYQQIKKEIKKSGRTSK